jgi:exonuclease SbcC
LVQEKTITELLKIHQFDSVDSVQAILKIWDVELRKAKQNSLPLICGGEFSADSEKLLMNQTLISKCLKIKNLVEECKLTYEAQLGKVSTCKKT